MERDFMLGTYRSTQTNRSCATLFSEGDRSVTEVKIITDRDTGRSRGFAFVEMGSQEEAEQPSRR